MLEIALCDDDFVFLADLHGLIKDSFSKYACNVKIDKFANGKSLIASIEKEKKYYDVVFLDIEMPEIDGFSTAARLRQLNDEFFLLFTTNLEDAAPTGYHYNAFRYILKRRLKQDVEEAVKTIMGNERDAKNSDEVVNFKFKQETGYDYTAVKRRDILFLEVRQRRVFLKTLHSDYELLVTPLREYKEMINSDAFIIVNRAYLVNLEHVEDITGDFLLLTGSIPVCMGYSKASKAAVKKQYMLFKKERI